MTPPGPFKRWLDQAPGTAPEKARRLLSRVEEPTALSDAALRRIERRLVREEAVRASRLRPPRWLTRWGALLLVGGASLAIASAAGRGLKAWMAAVVDPPHVIRRGPAAPRPPRPLPEARVESPSPVPAPAPAPAPPPDAERRAPRTFAARAPHPPARETSEEKPNASPPATSALAEEVQLVKRALQQIRVEHNPVGALVTLEEYHRKFGAGVLHREAERAEAEAFQQRSLLPMP